MATLPVDPINNAQQGLYYSYIGGSWTLNSMLESPKYLAMNARTDGGTDDARYETGPNPSLWANASGLVGLWRMDESIWNNNCSTLTVMDSSTNANHGKSCPNGSGPTSTVAGKVGNAGSFDGVDDLITIPDSSSLNIYNTDKISVQFWYKMNNIGNRGIELIGKTKYKIYAYDAPNWDPSLRDTYQFAVTIGGAEYYSNVYKANQYGTWHHIVGVYDGTKLKIYVDGKLGNQTNRSGLIDSSAGNTLNFRGNSLVGSIDEVRIYNRALSDMEIRAMYNATK